MVPAGAFALRLLAGVLAFGEIVVLMTTDLLIDTWSCA